MPRRTLAQRRTDAAREMALITELVAGTPGQRGPDWWVAIAARVCARHRVRSLNERAAGVAAPAPAAPTQVGAQLTRGQARCLRAVADHGSIDAAATALGCAPDTVKGQLGRARLTLHAPNTLTAVATALRAGLIT